MAAPAYLQTLRNLNDALRAELDALDSGDIAALESSTAAKLAAISALQLSPLAERDPEIDALIHEGAALCEQAALRVNLLLAGVERRLSVLARAAGHAPAVGYGRDGRVASGGYRSIDLDCA
jgi:hypothetical protein